jgi:3-hydroxyacyl-[acyl-carrier-protein] dehydratase
MRFLLLDRITRVETGRAIEAVKCVSLTEECFRGHFTRAALVPTSLLVESMAQLLGWLIVSTHGFRVFVVLTVLEDVFLSPDVRPGDRIELKGELLATNPKGSMGRATATVDGKVVASAGRVLYGQFPHPDPESVKARFRLAGGEA